MALKLFGHEFNMSTGSLMDIYQEGRKILNKISGGGSSPTNPSPTSEIKSEGPSTFAAAFTDEDEVAILSFIRFVDIEAFLFVRDLVKRMKEKDSPDFMIDGKKTGIKGQRRNSFLVRLVQLQQKIVEDIQYGAAKQKGQGQAKNQKDSTEPQQEQTVKSVTREDPRLTDKDARVLFLQWLYALYLRHHHNRRLTKDDLDAAYNSDERAIDKVIIDLEDFGLLTIEPLSKKAKDALTQFLKWAKGEGKEWLMSFDEDAIHLAWIIAGKGKEYDTVKAELKAYGLPAEQIADALKKRAQSMLPATPAEAQARVREVRRNAISKKENGFTWVAIAAVILMTGILIFS